MSFFMQRLIVALVAASAAAAQSSMGINVPFVDGSQVLIGGSLTKWDGPQTNVTSSVIVSSNGEKEIIGSIAAMGETDALKAVESATAAWKNGQGTWPQMTLEERATALQNVVKSLKERRLEIVETLKWDICKTNEDAASEFGKFPSNEIRYTGYHA